MMVFGCIAPHGGQLVAEVSDDRSEDTLALRAAMAEIGERARRAGVERWVVLTPHGVRVDGAMAVASAARAFGRVEPMTDGLPGLRSEFPIDLGLGDHVAAAATDRGIPVARTSYGGSVGEGRTLPLDWGASVPLSYVGRDAAGHPLPIVPITPTRMLSWRDMVTFGEAIADAAGRSGQRVGVLASSDLAHTHQAEGPYGFDVHAAPYDLAVRQAIEAGDPMALLDIDPDMVERAKPDGQWQILILAGALRGTELRTRFLAYGVPTYFGMLCAVCD